MRNARAYEALNVSYTQYVENHAYPNTEYAALQTRYNRDLEDARTLNYLSMALALIFLVSTLYLAIRKPTATPEQHVKDANK